MQNLQHQPVEVVKRSIQIILSTDKEIGEEVKWHAPVFLYWRDETL